MNQLIPSVLAMLISATASAQSLASTGELRAARLLVQADGEAAPPAEAPPAPEPVPSVSPDTELRDDGSDWANSAPKQRRARGKVRVVGFGTGLGGGFVAAASGALVGAGPALLLPTFEARFFLKRGNASVDLSLPLVNSLIVSATLGVFALSLDAFINFNVGDEGVRFLVGPGLGFGVASNNWATIIDIKVPVQLGVEFLTDNRLFGFSIQARPFFDIGILAVTGFGGAGTVVLGGGVMGVLAFNLYVTSEAKP